MKNLILSLIFICFAFTINAQTVHADTALKFNHSIGYCERQWIVMKKPDTASFYTFGYVYIDSLDGIIFQKEGTFSISRKGRYIRNPADIKQPTDRVVLFPVIGFPVGLVNLPPVVALLPEKHFKELKIKAEPKWVKPYYTYTDTLAYNYRRACFYAYAHYGDYAIDLFEKIYKVNPHYPGVEIKMDKYDFIPSQGIELKLALAYRVIGQYDNAISILNGAIANNPGNLSLYMLLGWCYDSSKNWNAAIDTFKKGLTLIHEEKNRYKYWLAGCISNAYESLKNDKERVEWRAKADQYNPHPGLVY